LLLKAIGKEMEWSWPLNKLGFINIFKLSTVAQEDYEVGVPHLGNFDKENGLLEHDLIKSTSFHEKVRNTDKKRVTCQAIDMDWVFSHNNAEVLIQMISNIEGKEALTKPPIRLFVRMMWSRLQPRIVSYVFFPYLIYLGLIMILSGSTVNYFLITRE
jgi:hypothetical protein